jgi:hypothetical protein
LWKGKEMSDLTELWKKGELKPNTYYCKIKDNDYIFRLNYEQGMFFDYFWERMEYDDIEEILAPVPSYEEWQQMKAFCEEFNALDVAEENQQLKEMLLKCREKLDKLDYGCEVWQGELTDFINEIDEVLR